MRAVRALASCAAFAVLGACATTPSASPVEVTRFHRLDTPLQAASTIRIASTPTQGRAANPHEPVYAQALAHELESLGFRVVQPGSTPDAAAQPTDEIAVFTLEEQRIVPHKEGSRVSVGGAGTAGTYGSGVGLGIGIDLSGPPPEQIATRLGLHIDDARSGERLWEGRAQQVVSVKSPFAAPEAGARRMAQALLGNFPGNSGETTIVK